MSRRPRLTVRARLTLLNTGLFAVCGAIVVAVSYVLVSQLKVPGATVVEDVLDARELADRRLHVSIAPALIAGDPILTELLIANLVDNAIRYSGPGGEISIRTETTDDGARLTVANNGPVIDPADSERIFEPFERLGHRSADDSFGLGLAIVASIASIHDGIVTAEPRGDGGLTVTLVIGAAEVEA